MERVSQVGVVVREESSFETNTNGGVVLRIGHACIDLDSATSELIMA